MNHQERSHTILRRKTRIIHVGDVPIGGDYPIAVQSMTNTDTRDVRATLRQINRLADAGCEIIRLAVPDMEAVHALREIRKKTPSPLIADIHFDHRLALASLDAGADGLRINPGNIGNPKVVDKIIRKARERNAAIRIGVNSGSLQKRILEKHGHPTAEAMVESALEYITLFEARGFQQLKVSLKSSNVLDTIAAYEQLSAKAETLIAGTVKSAIGIGLLLYNGIGDTFRVSLSSDPLDEVKAAYEILRALDIRRRGPEIISCPTCGRCEIDLFKLVREVEKGLAGIRSSHKVAIMGCVVNGPGEAKEADIGIAGGRRQGILFKKGRLIGKIDEGDMARVLIEEVRKMSP